MLSPKNESSNILTIVCNCGGVDSLSPSAKGYLSVKHIRFYCPFLADQKKKHQRDFPKLAMYVLLGALAGALQYSVTYCPYGSTNTGEIICGLRVPCSSTNVAPEHCLSDGWLVLIEADFQPSIERVVADNLPILRSNDDSTTASGIVAPRLWGRWKERV